MWLENSTSGMCLRLDECVVEANVDVEQELANECGCK